MTLDVCAHPLHERAVTRIENVHQLNISSGKKLGFQFLHIQPLFNGTKLSGYQLKRYALREPKVPGSSVVASSPVGKRRKMNVFLIFPIFPFVSK